MRFTLRDAHLTDATTDIARGAITIDDKHIQAVKGPGDPRGEQGNDVNEPASALTRLLQAKAERESKTAEVPA